MGFDIDPSKRGPRPSPYSPAPGAQGLSTQAKSRMLAMGFLGLLWLPWVFNSWHYVQRTGAYTCGWQGTVTSARPTLLSVTNVFTDSRRSGSYSYSWRNGERSTGHYVATVRLASGREIPVALSRDQYYSLTIPSYLVCHDDDLAKFPDETAARAAGVPAPAQGQ